MKLPRFFVLLVSLLTLSGCGLSGEIYPTPIPPEVLPTAILQTAAALKATALALTPSPTTTPTSTVTPTPTPTDTPTPIPPAPPARLQILAPGPASILASPLQMHLYVVPGETDLVQVSLFSEDELLLARDLTRVNDLPPPGLELFLEIPFEIRFAQLARLEVTTTDSAGRLEALTSMHLTLLPAGLSQINPPDPPFERAAIYSPEPKASVSGGILAVEGAFWPLNDQPVFLQLEDEKGMVWVRQLPPMVGDTYVSFSTTLPYKVFKPTTARLSIRQSDSRFNALAYLYSFLVILNP